MSKVIIHRLMFLMLIASCMGCGDDVPNALIDLYDELPEVVDYNYHIKPILSDRCYSCHGPDQNSREADLRLDIESEAKARLMSGNGKAIVTHRPGQSQMIKRIISSDPEFVMPPPESKLTLDQNEIALIAKWIDQGAEWKNHWSFIPPVKSDLPDPVAGWETTNEIDLFVHKRIQDVGLTPNTLAQPDVLLRRLYMDLTGLPPSVEALDKFLFDPSLTHYEKIVDSLLSSTAHAERLTMEWMDLARYADSHGLHADGWRFMWPWRDWVIGAFNTNMPYDEFVSTQLAGDLFPEATDAQRLATAFNRNHPMTAEGGAIDEEFRLSYVYDRTETMSTAFLGITLACARCHDHKFDPFSQDEYFQMTSFFNNIKELGMTGDDGNYGPMMFYADSDTQDKIEQLRSTVETKQSELDAYEIQDIMQYLEDKKIDDLKEGLSIHQPLDRIAEQKDEKGRTTYFFDGNRKAVHYNEPKLHEGKFGSALVFDKDYNELHLEGQGLFEFSDPFSVSIWIHTTQFDSSKTQTILGNSGEKNNFWRGWDLYLDESNHLNARLIHSLPHNYLHAQSSEVIQTDEWIHIGLTYDGSRRAQGLSLYINGKLSQSTYPYDKLYKSIYPVNGRHQRQDRALKVGKSGRLYTGESGIFYGLMDELRIYERALSAYEIGQLAIQPIVVSPLSIREWALHHDDNYQNKLAELSELQKSLLEVIEPIPEVMIMEESATPRVAYSYARGEYDKPSHTVSAATPSKIMTFDKELPQNRLGLTQWLFDQRNPLTARVAVNRYWQMIFGQGIVNTPHDFGSQGALPSHPDLLDYLAVDFVKSKWNLRSLLKKMVMSATYRQNSEVNKDKRAVDPTNTWLARGPSYRLPAEMIRDNALAASGLLVKHVGGASVRPYQPEGLWIEKGNFSNKLLTYKVTKGDSLYRRSLYTFVKRTSPHPVMTTFDAPNREVCTVKRERTNTPLQSLILMNDPQFVEAAKVMALRIQEEAGENIEDQITFAFRKSTGRTPSEKEVSILQELYSDSHKKFSSDPTAVEEILKVGEYALNDGWINAETAALTMVSNTILNHDDSYMKR